MQIGLQIPFSAYFLSYTTYDFFPMQYLLVLVHGVRPTIFFKSHWPKGVGGVGVGGVGVGAGGVGGFGSELPHWK
jgi:hypothetical protein